MEELQPTTIPVFTLEFKQCIHPIHIQHLEPIHQDYTNKGIWSIESVKSCLDCISVTKIQFPYSNFPPTFCQCLKLNFVVLACWPYWYKLKMRQRVEMKWNVIKVYWVQHHNTNIKYIRIYTNSFRIKIYTVGFLNTLFWFFIQR